MIVPSSGVKVLIVMKPVDFRKGMDGLAAVVRRDAGRGPVRRRDLCAFRSKQADLAKVVVLGWARAWSWRPSVSNRGSFRWPLLREGAMRLMPGQLVVLLEGLGLGAGACGANTARRRRSRDLDAIFSRLDSRRSGADSGEVMIYRRLLIRFPTMQGRSRELLIAARDENERLNAIVKVLQRHRFGPRSEKIDPHQIALMLEDVEQAIAAARRPRRKASVSQLGRPSGATARSIAARCPRHWPPLGGRRRSC